LHILLDFFHIFVSKNGHALGVPVFAFSDAFRKCLAVIEKHDIAFFTIVLTTLSDEISECPSVTLVGRLGVFLTRG